MPTKKNNRGAGMKEELKKLSKEKKILLMETSLTNRNFLGSLSAIGFSMAAFFLGLYYFQEMSNHLFFITGISALLLTIYALIETYKDNKQYMELFFDLYPTLKNKRIRH